MAEETTPDAAQDGPADGAAAEPDPSTDPEPEPEPDPETGPEPDPSTDPSTETDPALWGVAEAAEAADGTAWTGRLVDRLVRVQDQRRHRNVVAREIPAGASVLDVGCGTQRLRAHVYGDYRGLDREAGFEPDVVGDARDIPVPDDDVDVAVCKSLLIHLEDYERAVDELVRVARERVIVYESAWTAPTTRTQEEPVLTWLFNDDELVDLVAGGHPEDVSIRTERHDFDPRLLLVVRDL